MRAQLTLLSFAALAGCASTTTGQQPWAVPQPERPASWTNGERAPIPVTGDWVASFDDPTLSSLIGEALINSPDLQASAARVQAARAAAVAEYGSTLPSLNGGADADWTSNVIDVNDDAVRSEGPGFGLTLIASWEPDLWGRLAAGVAASDADLLAAEADFEAARLSITASTAIAWIQLNTAVRQLDLADETLEARERTLRLTERRFRNGLTGALDVRLARSAVETARASQLDQMRSTGEARRAIEVVLGRYPANEIEASDGVIQLTDIEGTGDPTSLLARRPDINAAEARIAAAGFRVEEARLALRPSLDLTARLFTSNADIVDALDPAFIAGQVASSLTAPIFNGGTIKANIEAAEAQARLTAANYVTTVLTAWQEVENALAADELLAAQVESQARALDEAEQAEILAERQYQNGLSTIFNLIDAQTRRINAEASLITAQNARAINRVQFHLALGGNLPENTELEDQFSEGSDL